MLFRSFSGDSSANHDINESVGVHIGVGHASAGSFFYESNLLLGKLTLAVVVKDTCEHTTCHVREYTDVNVAVVVEISVDYVGIGETAGQSQQILGGTECAVDVLQIETLVSAVADKKDVG